MTILNLEGHRNIVEHSEFAAFGCSHTWGVGVEAEEAWPYLINCKNFGVGACSADYIVRTAPEIIVNNNIKVVFILWPDWTRFEIFQTGVYMTSLPTDDDRIFYMEKYNEKWLIENFNKKVNGFRQWCQEQNLRLVDLTLYDLIPYIDHADTWPISKLGHHYAPEWHIKVAKIFKNSYENNIVSSLRYEYP